MIYKRDLFNTLFVLSFPMFGVGEYVAGSSSPTLGYMVGMSVYLLMLLIYGLDLLYKRDFSVKVNGNYGLMTLFCLSVIVCLQVTVFKGFPNSSMPVAFGKSLLYLVPFNAMIPVAIYNSGQGEKLGRLTFQGLSLLMIINILGFAAGLRNGVHSIEGRLSLPFIDSFYSGAGLMSILNLFIVYYMGKYFRDPVRLTGLVIYFIANMAMLFFINSRLTILCFLVAVILIVFNLANKTRLTFFISLFMLPILLNTGLLIYEILSQPIFASVMQRTDLVDVTTFNGRAFLWQDGINWLLFDQTGIFFGNGFKGFYLADIMSEMTRKIQPDLEHLHMHSTTFEILLNQGLFGYIIFITLAYRVFMYYKKHSSEKSGERIFYGVVIFMLFIMEVDTFFYVEALGGIVLCVLVASISIKAPAQEKPHEVEIAPELLEERANGQSPVLLN